MGIEYLIPFAGLCLAGVAIFLLRSRKRGNGSSLVRELLEQATRQRSVMVVEFTAPDLSHKCFLGPCLEFDEHTVLIDVSLPKEVSGWIGETVQVNFRIDTKNIVSFYQFTTRLRSLPHSANGFRMLLDAPAEIVSGQQRNFVRISPGREAVFGIGLWALQPTQARPDDPASLGVAQLSYRRDHTEHMSLLNVSAGGLCLQLNHPQETQPQGNQQQETPPLDPQVGDRLLCLLMVRSQTTDRPLPFWLDCTVANRREEQDGQHSIVGLNFSAWAVQHRGKKMDWFAVDGGAVGALGSWVLRQQITQFGHLNAG